MTRTFIYGSCVSRDTFQRLPQDRFTLLHYVARQSLISAFAPPMEDPPPHFETSSPFQRRMLLGDWESNLPVLVKEQAEHIDLFLWDLCDERLGLRQLRPPASGGVPHVATRSVDSLHAGFDSNLQGFPVIRFGSSRHKVRFTRALRRFNKEMRALHLDGKVLVLAPAWARYLANGEESPTSFGLSAGRANRMYDEYYAILREETAFPIIHMPPREAVGDAHHPWGPAPFHYTEKVYRRLAAEISRFTGG